jgi:hypothetical protein
MLAERHPQPKKRGGERDPSSHPTSEERQVKVWIHKLPTSLEEANSYSTNKPNDDEVMTSKSLKRPREQDD